MTSDPLPVVTAVRDPRAEVALQAGLAEYNTKIFRPGDRTTLDIVVYDDQSCEPVGGLLGHTSFRLFFLELFYLPETLRGRGLGSRILALAEVEARRRGCSAAYVYTVTFQAPEFYERHGYRRFGEIACPPDGATRVFFSKSLYANGTTTEEIEVRGLAVATRLAHSRLSWRRSPYPIDSGPLAGEAGTSARAPYRTNFLNVTAGRLVLKKTEQVSRSLG